MSFKFNLNGYGLLQSIEESSLGAVVKIKVLSDSTDEVVLQCLTDSCDIKAQIYQFCCQYRLSNYVVLHFNVEYSHLGYVYPGQIKTDPNNMAQVHGKLVSVCGWVLDGLKPIVQSPQQLENHCLR